MSILFLLFSVSHFFCVWTLLLFFQISTFVFIFSFVVCSFHYSFHLSNVFSIFNGSFSFMSILCFLFMQFFSCKCVDFLQGVVVGQQKHKRDKQTHMKETKTRDKTPHKSDKILRKRDKRKAPGTKPNPGGTKRGTWDKQNKVSVGRGGGVTRERVLLWPSSTLAHSREGPRGWSACSSKTVSSKVVFVQVIFSSLTVSSKTFFFQVELLNPKRFFDPPLLPLRFLSAPPPPPSPSPSQKKSGREGGGSAGAFFTGARTKLCVGVGVQGCLGFWGS